MKQKERRKRILSRLTLHLHIYLSPHSSILSFKSQFLSMTEATGVWALHTLPVPSFPESALPPAHPVCSSHTELLAVSQMY